MPCVIQQTCPARASAPETRRGRRQEPAFGEAHGGGAGERRAEGSRGARNGIMRGREKGLEEASSPVSRLRSGVPAGSTGVGVESGGSGGEDDGAVATGALLPLGGPPGRAHPASAWLDAAAPVSPPAAPERPVLPLLAGRLPDREEDRPGAVQRGVQGHLPAGQEDGGSEEGAGEPATPWVRAAVREPASLWWPRAIPPPPPAPLPLAEKKGN